jgi:hypothetical protein
MELLGRRGEAAEAAERCYRPEGCELVGVDRFPLSSQTARRMATLLTAALQNSHQNGGWVFLIFVADPITVRLCLF